MKREQPTGENWWIVTENAGRVLGLLTGCHKRKDAQRIAESVLPDIAERGGIMLISWPNAAKQQRRDAQQGIHITPRLCARLEIPAPNQLPPPLTIEGELKRLQTHFEKRRTIPADGAQLAHSEAR